jgi:hypothetical protein
MYSLRKSVSPVPEKVLILSSFLQLSPLFKRIMGGSGNFFRNLLPFKGGPDGPGNPKKKGEEDS